MRSRALLGAIVVPAVLMAAPSDLVAQTFPALGGIGARVGVAVPENADPGPSLSVDLDLGSLGIGSVRTIAGLHYFAVNRTEAGASDPGSYTATGGRVGLRLDLFGTRQLTPYLLAAVTGHQVSADVADQQVRDLLDSFYAGASLGAGVAFSFDEAGRLAATGELRRTLASNIDHYAFELGMRYLLRGPRSYERPPSAVRPAEPGLDPRIALERERQEAERRRLEDERLAAERERLARAAEADRRQSGQQVERAEQEAALARQRASAAEQAQREEAEARARAERAAAEAAGREEVAASSAREAQARATEAERRLYASLLDLDRLIANVTGIQETERGLAVVVGQGLFASGQSALSAAARGEVGRIAAVLAQFPEHRIAVEGHTDAVGSETSNQRLSELRAESVRAALIAEGIDPARVDALGYGQSRPVAGNATAAQRAQNRRVEIVILGARRPTDL